MKITKEGEIPKKEKKGSCYNCQTKFNYDSKDIHQDRDGLYVHCPKCSKFITVNP